MEIVVAFFVAAFIVVVVLVVLVWRSRARTGGLGESPTSGTPDDLRDENVGRVIGYGATRGRGDPWIKGGR